MLKEKEDILSKLKIEPSAQSIDYVNQKKQFHLHTLLTEQRHPKTWNLSSTIQNDTQEGLKQIFTVDEDIVLKFDRMTNDMPLLERAAQTVFQTILNKKKIYIYGCGATGRLAKQMESAVWRPFWRKVKRNRLWSRMKKHLPEEIEECLIGEMTGGDRALISALEGFEDLELVGRLQLQDREIERGDAVFCITEGGETSSVIGTLKAALRLYEPLDQHNTEEASQYLHFIYNNPDGLLRPLDRSRSVIDNPAISKINLATGPQAIAGSTRMQATSAETFVMGVILEAAIFRLLQQFLSPSEQSQFGFGQNFRIEDRLSSYASLCALLMNSIGSVAQLTELESDTYRTGRRATYFAERALIPVFIDGAERSPTFHLDPLDNVWERERKCWLQVWTGAQSSREAWRRFLGRSFRGLDEDFYRPHFETEIKDPYLKAAAQNSLRQAGSDQEELYDFSFSDRNIKKRGPERGDLGVLTSVDEEQDEIACWDSLQSGFIRLFKQEGARVAAISVGKKAPRIRVSDVGRLPLENTCDLIFHLPLTEEDDPLQLNRQILLKILFNGLSTGVMARLGRVVGNTMTGVKPSNLKLVGRATALITSHVNDTLSHWKRGKISGHPPPLSYKEANAVLFDAMEFLKGKDSQASEVELSIVRILETLRRDTPLSWEKALSLVGKEGLENYLKKLNPALRPQ